MIATINFESLHVVELEFIRLIHEFRTSFLDTFLKQFDFFDRQEFFFILIPILWFGKGWRTGLKLFYILFLSSVVNHLLKEYFSFPRPFHIDPSLGIIQVSGYGLPSGAAQSVILLSIIALNWWKGLWTGVITTLYILSVSFSRIYLGIHFPSDILAGWLIGGFLGLVYTYVIPVIERQFESVHPSILFCISQMIPLFLFFWQRTIPLSFIAMGMSLGLFINHIYWLNLPLPQNNQECILRVMIGVIGTFLFYELLLVLSFENMRITLFLRFFLLGLWVSLGFNLICRKLFLKKIHW